jgi:superfamily II RNA helicase
MARADAVAHELAQHPVNQWGDRSHLTKKIAKLEQLQRQYEFQRSVVGDRRQQHWADFMDLVEVLRDLNCLDDIIPTSLGQVVASLRGDNELWLALALCSGELDTLYPHHLATVCAALVIENNRPDTRVRVGLSPTVEETLDALRPLRRQLIDCQRRHRVDIPIWLEYDLAAIIELWASDVDWEDLCTQSNLDEGDIVRMTRRTLDLLHQLPHIHHLPATLRQSAQEAIQKLDRFPISEVL